MLLNSLGYSLRSRLCWLLGLPYLQLGEQDGGRSSEAQSPRLSAGAKVLYTGQCSSVLQGRVGP